MRSDESALLDVASLPARFGGLAFDVRRIDFFELGVRGDEDMVNKIDAMLHYRRGRKSPYVVGGVYDDRHRHEHEHEHTDFEEN